MERGVTIHGRGQQRKRAAGVRSGNGRYAFRQRAYMIFLDEERARPLRQCRGYIDVAVKLLPDKAGEEVAGFDVPGIMRDTPDFGISVSDYSGLRESRSQFIQAHAIHRA